MLFPLISCKLEEKEKLALALLFVKKLVIGLNVRRKFSVDCLCIEHSAQLPLPERQPQLLGSLTHPVYFFGKDFDGVCAASLLMIA